MNSDIKRRWVAALRSGNYEQGFGSLISKDMENNKYHCCLGVLCDVVKNDPEIKKKHKAVFRSDGEELPEHIRKYVGIPKYGIIGGYGQNYIQNKLIVFNDDKKWSFKKIAAYIERYL